MSARDSESGSSTYKGGSGSAGGLGNGGIGGGMGGGGNYGGGGGGGAGRNGGIGSRTGMTTGKDWYGNTAFGRSGGNVIGYGMRDARSLGRAGMGPTVGSFGNFRTPTGQAMFAGSPVQGMTFNGMGMGQALSQAQRAQAAWEAAQRRQSVPGLLGGAQPAGISATPQYPGVEAEMALPEYPPVDDNPLIDVQPGLPPLSGVPTAPIRFGPWPGQSAIPNNPATFRPGAVQVGKTDNLARQPKSNPTGKGDFQGNFGLTSRWGR